MKKTISVFLMLLLVSGCERVNALRNAPPKEQIVVTDKVVNTSWLQYVKDNKALVAYSSFITVLAIGAIAAAIICYNKQDQLDAAHATIDVQKSTISDLQQRPTVEDLQREVDKNNQLLAIIAQKDRELALHARLDIGLSQDCPLIM